MKFISYCCLQGTPPPFTEFYSHMCHDHCHFTTQGGLVQPEWLTAPIVPDSLFSFGAPVASPYYPSIALMLSFYTTPQSCGRAQKYCEGPVIVVQTVVFVAVVVMLLFLFLLEL